MQEACLVVFLCLAGSVQMGSGEQRWRWRGAGPQQSSAGAQGSAGRGFGSCNHMETDKKRFFLKILAERQVTGRVWKSDGLDRSVPNWKFLRFHRTA